jgi:FKBP-type peptidyl-prolyl cis-trans isomerase FklB
MRKMHWLVVLSIGVLGLQANGQQASTDPREQSGTANKERVLHANKISVHQKAALQSAQKADSNRQGSLDYLASNKGKSGVISLPSGVQYRVLVAGVGKKVAESIKVTMRYHGTLMDGRSFDKVDDKKPAAMLVAGLLPGLKETVKLIPVGSKWEIVVPPELAYGAQGNRAIGPNAVLIYEVEVLGVM